MRRTLLRLLVAWACLSPALPSPSQARAILSRLPTVRGPSWWRAGLDSCGLALGVGDAETAVRIAQGMRPRAERVLGAGSPAVANLLDTLATGLLMITPDSTRVPLQLIRMALDSKTRALGRNHPETASSLRILTV